MVQRHVYIGEFWGELTIQNLHLEAMNANLKSLVVAVFFQSLLLVGGLEHGFFVPFHIWVFILPIHELIFFKMVIAPPTRLDFQSHSTMVSPYGQAVCFWIVLETPSRCFRHHSD